MLTDTDDEPLALEPRTEYDEAILGLARRFNSTFLVYDERRILEIIEAETEDDDEDPETSAREHYEFNILGGWVGEGTPAFMVPFREPPVPLFRVRVDGAPIPQGSKRAWVNPKTQRVMMAEQAGAELASWRHEVTLAAKGAMREAGLTEPIEAAVSVSLTFYQTRNIGHYGTGKNAHNVKAGSPGYPAKAPDIDKLSRAILDSLTDAKLWVDDGQVVSLLARKRYVDRHGTDSNGVLITVGLQ